MCYSDLYLQNLEIPFLEVSPSEATNMIRGGSRLFSKGWCTFKDKDLNRGRQFIYYFITLSGEIRSKKFRS